MKIRTLVLCVIAILVVAPLLLVARGIDWLAAQSGRLIRRVFWQ